MRDIASLIGCLSDTGSVVRRMEPSGVKSDPFPVQSKESIGKIDGVETKATTLFFADRILVTLSQEGRLSQWVSIFIINRITGGWSRIDWARRSRSRSPSPRLLPSTW